MKRASRLSVVGHIAALLFVAWAPIAIIDRLWWVNDGSGLAGWVNGSELKKAGIPDCDKGAELKYIGAELHYRCGSIAIWPLYLGHSGHSEALQVQWEKFVAKTNSNN